MNVPVDSTKYSDWFLCCLYRINKIRHSPKLAPLFSDCESSRAIAFYVNTIQKFNPPKNKVKHKKEKGKRRD